MDKLTIAILSDIIEDINSNKGASLKQIIDYLIDIVPLTKAKTAFFTDEILDKLSKAVDDGLFILNSGFYKLSPLGREYLLNANLDRNETTKSLENIGKSSSQRDTVNTKDPQPSTSKQRCKNQKPSEDESDSSYCSCDSISSVEAPRKASTSRIRGRTRERKKRSPVGNAKAKRKNSTKTNIQKKGSKNRESSSESCISIESCSTIDISSSREDNSSTTATIDDDETTSRKRKKYVKRNEDCKRGKQEKASGEGTGGSQTTSPPNTDPNVKNEESKDSNGSNSFTVKGDDNYDEDITTIPVETVPEKKDSELKFVA